MSDRKHKKAVEDMARRRQRKGPEEIRRRMLYLVDLLLTGARNLGGLPWCGGNLLGLPLDFVSHITGLDPSTVALFATARAEKSGGYFEVASGHTHWRYAKWVAWHELPALLLALPPSRAESLDRYEVILSLQEAAADVLIAADDCCVPTTRLKEVLSATVLPVATTH